MSRVHEKVRRLTDKMKQRDAARLLGGIPQQAITAFRRGDAVDFKLTTVVRIVEATASLPADERITWSDFSEHAHELMAQGIGLGKSKRAPPPSPRSRSAVGDPHREQEAPRR